MDAADVEEEIAQRPPGAGRDRIPGAPGRRGVREAISRLAEHLEVACPVQHVAGPYRPRSRPAIGPFKRTLESDDAGLWKSVEGAIRLTRLTSPFRRVSRVW